ncbi:PAS domain-containing protein [Anaeromyxobacter terrae]|uniref:PAS domain-containing protein n=1 Tax=Anaeromyxobacter terrae TaxID=2925406 RepID=UPI001F5883D4|nr:PAS domain-containing protein [Anaeromyxobacter sp. SG22]
MGGIPLWRSITGRVVLVVLAWLVPFVAISACAGAVVYRERIGAELDANLELARAASHAFDGFVRDVLRQEELVGDAIATRRLAPDVVDLLLSRAEQEYISVRDLSWVTPDGRVVASSDRRLVGRSTAERDDLRRLLAGAVFTVSDVRAAESDGSRSVAIARAVREGGELKGIVLATVDATRLGELALPFERLGRADIALADHRGEIVFRRPGEGGPAGGVLDTAAVAQALRGGEIARRTPEGGAITAAVPVSLVGWAAVASRSYADVASPFRTAIARAAGLGAAAAALAVLVSVLVTRRIARALRRLEQHVQVLGRGSADLAPVTGPAEIVRLGRAFDDMAGKLVAANASLVLHERIFETSPDSMIVLDRALRLRAVNPAYAAMRGLPTADLLGRPLVEIIGVDAFDAMAPRIERAFGGESVQYELWTDLPAGRRCVEASYHPVREGNRLEHVAVRFRDVTDRRHAEAAASQSLAIVEAERRRFEAVFREAPAGIVIFDGRDLRAKWSNRTYLSFLDAPFAQLGIEGLRIEDFVPNAGEAGLVEIIRRVAATGEPADTPEYRLDGLARGATWWRWSVRPIPGEIGPDVLLLVTEVTEQVEARKVAEDERLRLEAILRTLPVGVILAGPDGRAASSNDHARQIWGGDAALDAYRGAWAETGLALAPGDWAIQRAVLRGETVTGELIDIVRFDGERATILNNAAPIRDAFGRITGAVAAFQDVTETRRAQQEAEDAVRRRDEVLAIVSHDLRTPLSAIVMGARMLGGALAADPERVRTTAARIASSGDRMNRLIGDLLDLTSLERGGLSMHRQPLAPRTLAREAADVIRPQAEAKGLEVRCRAPEELPLVSCDHDRVLQVLGNLTSNAVKATAEGHVAIAAIAHGDQVVFEVRDTGPGIPAEELPHVFDRFRRGRSAPYAGTGLGLAIARALIEAHGGRIWAESTPGAGTVVRFALPVASAPAPEREAVAG